VRPTIDGASEAVRVGSVPTVSWETARADAFESIALRAGYEPVGRLPAIFGPSGKDLAASFATVGLHLLDDMLDAPLPVSPMMRAELLRAIQNNVTGERAERAADLFSRALLAAAMEHPEERDAPERWAERLMQHYNGFRPHQSDLEEVAALAARAFDYPPDEFDEDAEDAFDRRRRWFCVYVGQRGLEIVVGAELPDSAQGFFNDPIPLAEYDQLWLDAHNSMLQVLKQSAQLGVEASEDDPEPAGEGESNTSSRWTLSGLRETAQVLAGQLSERIRRR
jgi:hypothetical protein